jgi:hypothetical protein
MGAEGADNEYRWQLRAATAADVAAIAEFQTES